MAVGLELRAPFLDHTFVELLGTVPLSLRTARLGGGGWKRLLKRALADRLPAETLRRHKQGFGVPFASWFRGRPARTVTRRAGARATSAGVGSSTTRASRVWSTNTRAGRRDHATTLWAALVLELWRNYQFGDR